MTFLVLYVVLYVFLFIFELKLCVFLFAKSDVDVIIFQLIFT